MPASRANSIYDGFPGHGIGRPHGTRENSPARRPSHGASTSRHPYMDDYARRNVHSNNTSPTNSPLPGYKRPITVKGKRSSLDQGPNNNRAVAGLGGDYSDEEDNGNDIPEGVEKDGMMWGMKTEDYRALSARERKRVRNRISARTFRARRKEHLNDLESGMVERNAIVKAAHDEIQALKMQNEELRQRLSKYEAV